MNTVPLTQALDAIYWHVAQAMQPDERDWFDEIVYRNRREWELYIEDQRTIAERRRRAGVTDG